MENRVKTDLGDSPYDKITYFGIVSVPKKVTINTRILFLSRWPVPKPCLDGSNRDQFIDTFNSACDGRNDLFVLHVCPMTPSCRRWTSKVMGGWERISPHVVLGRR